MHQVKLQCNKSLDAKGNTAAGLRIISFNIARQSLFFLNSNPIVQCIAMPNKVDAGSQIHIYGCFKYLKPILIPSLFAISKSNSSECDEQKPNAQRQTSRLEALYLLHFDS
ncbi:MAG: hypothetical protein EZS28_012878 [Streblomastix strix]|uniref:Uncharacterized protein n=1 Tax=Streblomastix strix TaxID=222440 RepID=A0A5J4WAC0_9EUKA|nr:MAG: hypothetical protein EZS28_012878 [Streblomastix strix]